MQFSNIISGASSAVFSPDSAYLAISNGQKVLIKDTKELMNKSVFSFNDIITHMEFSPDSTLILTVQQATSVVELRSLLDEKWVCKIVDQAAGILHAVWAPNSRSIITFSDYQMKATVYNLTDKQQLNIKNPKFTDKGVSFTSDGKFMALAERRDIKDYIGIYHTSDWKLVNHFQVDTMDLVDLAWSKDNSHILVWDTSINYKFLVYHPSNGLVQRVQPYEYALGIKSVSQSSSPNFLALGSYDDKIRILNTLTWRVVSELEHKSNLREYPNAVVYREQNGTLMNSLHLQDRSTTTFVIDDSANVKLAGPKPPITDKATSSGITESAFSVNAHFLATRTASFPNAVFVWDMSLLELRFLIVLQNPIKSFVWSQNSTNLLVYSSSNKIYFWSQEGASVCELPSYGKQFNVNKVAWCNNSRCIVLIDRKDTIIAYPPLDIEEEEEEQLQSENSQQLEQQQQQHGDSHQNDQMQFEN